MDFDTIIDSIGKAVDAAGVVVMVVGISIASGLAGWRYLRRKSLVFEEYRRWVGRSILLGLEILIAADIIRTVAIGFSVDAILALGLIVLIRTFLSLTLQLEMTGRWPWQTSHGGVRGDKWGNPVARCTCGGERSNPGARPQDPRES
ncbi:DUF1622 domain-containing protein [Nesterenkonia sp. LB17]|uniref:DUF1622 domain-containing protein n=1 Tax=Nesterenkonia sp. LB17 TaxID=2901230 RepID=UPI001F4D25FB|nr:DUF1622 domain-containing protein [Nesterenkonia sp. LB17]MCH8566293.1 DUF1622 domain-containing protein [Nesterenkonia sp. LB17]